MNITAVDSVSFDGKQRFLSKNGHENLKTILKNINAETTMKKNDFCWSSEFIKSVTLKNENVKVTEETAETEEPEKKKKSRKKNN